MQIWFPWKFHIASKINFLCFLKMKLIYFKNNIWENRVLESFNFERFQKLKKIQFIEPFICSVGSEYAFDWIDQKDINLYSTDAPEAPPPEIYLKIIVHISFFINKSVSNVLLLEISNFQNDELSKISVRKISILEIFIFWNIWKLRKLSFWIIWMLKDISLSERQETNPRGYFSEYPEAPRSRNWNFSQAEWNLT